MQNKHKIPKKWLGAFSKGHRACVQEYIDNDFSYRLLAKALKGDEEAIKALDYLTRFNNEFHKNVIKKGDRKALHRTKKLRLSLYARENAKNRDIMSIAKKDRVGFDFSREEIIEYTGDPHYHYTKSKED